MDSGYSYKVVTLYRMPGTVELIDVGENDNSYFKMRPSAF